MKVLVDMNLSPSWVPTLENHGFSAIHWSSVGDGRAPDPVVLGWAHDNGYEAILQQGALITIDEGRLRSRILPL